MYINLHSLLPLQYDGVTILGRSEHAQSMMDQGRLANDCKRAGGVSIQPNQGMGVSISFHLEGEVLNSYHKTLSSHVLIRLYHSNNRLAPLLRTLISQASMYAQKILTLTWETGTGRFGTRVIKSVTELLIQFTPL